MGLGPFVGPIYTIILIVDCLFFAFLEWWMPRDDIDYVDVKWDTTRFETVGLSTTLSRRWLTLDLAQVAGQGST